jgi:hypothetical protein
MGRYLCPGAGVLRHCADMTHLVWNLGNVCRAGLRSRVTTSTYPRATCRAAGISSESQGQKRSQVNGLTLELEAFGRTESGPIPYPPDLPERFEVPPPSARRIPVKMFILKRGMATLSSLASLKRAGKVVCIGRNYAFVKFSLINVHKAKPLTLSSVTTSPSSTAPGPSSPSSSKSPPPPSCCRGRAPSSVPRVSTSTMRSNSP